MTDSILLEVLTPERRVFSAQVSDLQFPTARLGYYGILPGHTPLVTPLGDGLVYYTQNDQKHWLTVFGGFAEVEIERGGAIGDHGGWAHVLDADREWPPSARLTRSRPNAVATRGQIISSYANARSTDRSHSIRIPRNPRGFASPTAGCASERWRRSRRRRH